MGDLAINFQKNYTKILHTRWGSLLFEKKNPTALQPCYLSCAAVITISEINLHLLLQIFPESETTWDRFPAQYPTDFWAQLPHHPYSCTGMKIRSKFLIGSHSIACSRLMVQIASYAATPSGEPVRRSVSIRNASLSPNSQRAQHCKPFYHCRRSPFITLYAPFDACITPVLTLRDMANDAGRKRGYLRARTRMSDPYT